MAYYDESRTSHNTHPRTRTRRRHTSRHTPERQPRRTTHVRYTSPDAQPPNSPPPPRRRRWAKGYIDQHSCPSYAYIDTRSRSPDDTLPSDTEYIAQPRYRAEEYIQPLKRRRGSLPRRGREHDSDGLGDLRRASRPVIKSADRGSDVESLDGGPSARRQRRRQSRDESPPLSAASSSLFFSSSAACVSDLQRKTPVAFSAGRPSGSDTVSLRRRRSSSSSMCSDTQSIGSLGARSDVQERRGRVNGIGRGGSGRRSASGSASDSEGGYISLDGYIAGSDCVSVRGGYRERDEDDGEGSDAVGSDVVSVSDEGEGSDGVMGSDVEYFDGSAGGGSE